jgi:hypothetical protein
LYGGVAGYVCYKDETGEVLRGVKRGGSGDIVLFGGSGGTGVFEYYSEGSVAAVFGNDEGHGEYL